MDTMSILRDAMAKAGEASDLISELQARPISTKVANRLELVHRELITAQADLLILIHDGVEEQSWRD